MITECLKVHYITFFFSNYTKNKCLTNNQFVQPYLNKTKVNPNVKFVKTQYRPKNENHRILVFDSSNKAPEHTECNAKNLNSFRCTLAEKIKNKKQKMVILGKILFWEFFSIFSATVHRTELRFFFVAIIASWRFI